MSMRSCACQNSTMDFDVVEIKRDGTATVACNVTSAGNLTRWTYLSETTETILMSFQNGLCTVSPSNSFLSDDRFSYTCNSTVYQVTILPYAEGGRSINNNILACRDALQPDMTDSTWIIKINRGNYVSEKGTTTDCSYCEPKMTFNVLEVIEDNNLTFVCKVSSNVAFTNWNLNIRSKTVSIGVSMDQCATASNGTTFLDNTNEYIYTCNKTVYQVTRLNVQRSEHNDMYMCTPAYEKEGTGSNWIINVKAPVTSVVMTPSNYLVNVTENTTQKFTCTTSTARPAASVYWYIHTNGNKNDVTQITKNVTTTTDYNDLSVTTNKADDPYINVSNEYRVIEDSQGTLSCSAKGGNPTPTLSWSCNNFSSANQPTISSNGSVTSTLTWTALRNHNGMCTCTSQQTGFQDKKIYISLVVLYPPSKPVFKVNGSNVVGDIHFVEGKSRSINCTADSKPSPGIYTWTGPTIVNPMNNDTLIFNEIKKTDAGQYTCSAHNTMQPSSGGSVAGINNNSVNVVVLYEANITSFTIDGLDEDTLTVNESDTVSFVCKADSNPTAMMTLSHGNEILNSLTSSSLEYIVNAGLPRAANVIEMNITSEKDVSFTIVLNVIAYPPPNFTWYQLVEENWTLLHNNDKYFMNSSNLQSNLSIHRVGMQDFTEYKVIVKNYVGHVEQLFYLSPSGKPDSPTQFTHIEGSATSSSVHLEWKPGFDNGPSQTFYIKYKKSTDTLWNYLNISDNGDQIMHVELTGLTEDTKYEIVIFASNKKGNSSESPVLFARTKAIDKPSLGPLIGGIAGGVTGFIILIIVIIVIIRRYPVFKGKGVNEPGIRRSVSDDSDEDDGLVDNPMYVSSNNVASASAVPSSSGVFTTPPKPKQASNEDLYTVVNKTKRQDKVQKGKTSTGKNTNKGVDVYENVELANKPAKNDGSKQSPPKNESNRVPKLKVVNKDGLIYADLVFNDKPPGEKMVINGDDPTPYAFVDFTKKAEPLPESDNEDEK
ncbi:myoblast fusion [Mactra antiquata]